MMSILHFLLGAAVMTTIICKKTREVDDDLSPLMRCCGGWGVPSHQQRRSKVSFWTPTFWTPTPTHRKQETILFDFVEMFNILLTGLLSLGIIYGIFRLVEISPEIRQQRGSFYLRMTLWDELGIPGPPCDSAFGHLRLINSQGGLRESVNRWLVKYGPIFGIYIGRQPVLVVADCEIVSEIFRNGSGCFCDRCMEEEKKVTMGFDLTREKDVQNRKDIPKVLCEPPLQGNLFSAPEIAWESLHFNHSSTFSPTNLKYMVHRLNRCAMILAEYMEDEAVSQFLKVNIEELMMSYVYDCMAALILGLETDHREDSNDAFFKAVKAALDSSTLDYGGVTVPGTVRELESYITNVIEERRVQSSHMTRLDYVDIMMNAGSRKDNFRISLPSAEMGDDEITATMLFWVLHGHATLLSALQFVVYLLAENPNHQETILKEIQNVIGSEDPTFEDLMQLPFLDKVIDESLRLFSPVQEIWRRVNDDTHIRNIHFPKDSSVLIPVQALHFNQNYFPSPHLFLPDRWKKTGDVRLREHRSEAFIPFGEGSRACVGQKLSLLQIKLALVHCIRRVQFLTSNDESESSYTYSYAERQMIARLAVTKKGTLRPYKGVYVRLRPRAPENVILSPEENKRVSLVNFEDSLDKEADMLTEKTKGEYFYNISGENSDLELDDNKALKKKSALKRGNGIKPGMTRGSAKTNKRGHASEQLETDFVTDDEDDQSESSFISSNEDFQAKSHRVKYEDYTSDETSPLSDDIDDDPESPLKSDTKPSGSKKKSKQKAKDSESPLKSDTKPSGSKSSKKHKAKAESVEKDTDPESPVKSDTKPSGSKSSSKKKAKTDGADKDKDPELLLKSDTKTESSKSSSKKKAKAGSVEIDTDPESPVKSDTKPSGSKSGSKKKAKAESVEKDKDPESSLKSDTKPPSSKSSSKHKKKAEGVDKDKDPDSSLKSDTKLSGSKSSSKKKAKAEGVKKDKDPESPSKPDTDKTHLEVNSNYADTIENADKDKDPDSPVKSDTKLSFSKSSSKLNAKAQGADKDSNPESSLKSDIEDAHFELNSNYIATTESADKCKDPELSLKSHTKPSGSKSSSKIKAKSFGADEDKDPELSLKSNTKPSGSKSSSKIKAKTEGADKDKDPELSLKSDTKPSSSKLSSKHKAKDASVDEDKDPESPLKSYTEDAYLALNSNYRTATDNADKDMDPESPLKSDTKPPGSKSSSKIKAIPEGADKDKSDTEHFSSKLSSKHKAKDASVDKDKDPESLLKSYSEDAYLALNSNYRTATDNADKDMDPESPLKSDTKPPGSKSSSKIKAIPEGADKDKPDTETFSSKLSSKHKAKNASVDKDKDPESPLKSYTEDAYLALNSNYRIANDNADKDMDPESPLKSDTKPSGSKSSSKNKAKTEGVDKDKSDTEPSSSQLSSKHKAKDASVDKDKDPESLLKSYTEDAYLALNSNYRTATDNADKDMDPESPLKLDTKPPGSKSSSKNKAKTEGADKDKFDTEPSSSQLSSKHKAKDASVDKDKDPESLLKFYTEDAYLALNSNYKTASENADKDMDPESPLKSDTKYSGSKLSSKQKANTEGADEDKDSELFLKSDTESSSSKSSSKHKAKIESVNKDKDPQSLMKSYTDDAYLWLFSNYKTVTENADEDKDPESPLKSDSKSSCSKSSSKQKTKTEGVDKDKDPKSPLKSDTKAPSSNSQTKVDSTENAKDSNSTLKSEIKKSHSKLRSKRSVKAEVVESGKEPDVSLKSEAEDPYSKAHLKSQSKWRAETESVENGKNTNSPLKSNDSQSKPCLNYQTIDDIFDDSNDSPLSQTVGLTQFSCTLKTIVFKGDTTAELAFTYKPLGVAITTDSGSLDPFNTESTGFYVNGSDCSAEEKSQNNPYASNEPNENGYNIDILTEEKSKNNPYTSNEPNESGNNIDILTEEKSQNNPYTSNEPNESGYNIDILTEEKSQNNPYTSNEPNESGNNIDILTEEESQNNPYTSNEPNESGNNIDILTEEESQNNPYTSNEPNESGYNIDILTEENISTHSTNVGTPFIGPSLHEVPSLNHNTDQGLSDFSTNSKVSEFPGSVLKKDQEMFQQGKFKTDVSPKKCTQKDSVASKESQYWSCQTSLENSAVAVKGDNYLQSQSNVGIPSTFRHSESMQRQVSPPEKMEMSANAQNRYAECSAALNQRLNYVSQDSKSQSAHVNARRQPALAPGKSYFEQTNLASHPVLEIQSKKHLQSLPIRDSQPKPHQSTSALLNEVKARLICSEQNPTTQVTRYLQTEKDESRNQSLPYKTTDRKLMYEDLRNLLPVQSVGTESDILVTSKPKPYARESNSHNSGSLSWQRERTSHHFPIKSAPILSPVWEEDSAFRSVQMDHSKNSLEDENIFTVSWSDDEYSSLFQTPDLSREASFIEVEASFSTSGTDSENCLHWSQDRICFEDETTSSDEENVSLFQKVTNVINSYKSRFTEENASKAYRRSQRRKVKMLKRLFAPITSAFQLLLDILRAVITRFTNKIDKERTKVRPYSPRDQFHDNLLIAVKNKPLTPIGSVIKSNPQGNWPVCKRCVPDSADFAFQSQINCARSVYKTPKMNEHDLVKELLDKCLSDIQLSSAEESSLVPQYTHTKKIVAQLADFFRSNLDPESRELVEIQTHDTGERMLERNESGRESDVESVYTDDILGDADVPSTSSRKPSLKTKKVQKKKNKTSSEAASEDFGKSKKKTHRSQAPTVEVKPKHFPAQNSDRGKSMHFVKSEANSLRHPRTYVEDSLRSLARTAREVIPIVLLAPLTPFIDMFLSTGSLSQEGASADTKAEKEKGKFKTADVDSFGRNNSQFRAARHCRTHDKVAIYSGIPDQDTYVMTMTSSRESDSDEVEEEEFRLNLPGRRPLIVDIGASCSTFEDDQPCSFQNSKQRETDSSPDSVRSKYNNMQCGSMEDFNINKPRGEFILHTTETPSISVVAASHRSSKSEIHEDINESSSKDGYASRNKESNIGKSLSEIFTSHSSSIVSLSCDAGISYSNNILPASRDSGTLYSNSMLLLLQDVQEINSYRPLSQAKTDSYGNFSRRRSENDFQKTKKRSPEKREDGTSHYCSAPNLLSSETGFLDCDKFDGNNRSEEFDLTETALHPIKTLGVDETVFVRTLSQRGRGFYDSFGKSKSVKEFCFKRKEKLPSPRDVGTMYYINSQTENGSFGSHSDHKVYLKKTNKRQLLRETFSVEDYGARLSVPIRDVVANISSKSLAHSAASIFISRSQNTSQESIPLQVTRLDKESTVYYGARPDDETSESGVYEEMKEGAIPEEDWQPTPIDSTTGISRLEETSSEWGQKSGQKCDTFRLEKNDKPASPEASTSTSDKKSKQN